MELQYIKRLFLSLTTSVCAAFYTDFSAAVHTRSKLNITSFIRWVGWWALYVIITPVCVIGFVRACGFFKLNAEARQDSITSFCFLSADDILISHLLFVSATRHTSHFQLQTHHQSLFVCVCVYCEATKLCLCAVRSCLCLPHLKSESKRRWHAQNYHCLLHFRF